MSAWIHSEDPQIPEAVTLKNKEIVIEGALDPHRGLARGQGVLISHEVARDFIDEVIAIDPWRRLLELDTSRPNNTIDITFLLERNKQKIFFRKRTFRL